MGLILGLPRFFPFFAPTFRDKMEKSAQICVFIEKVEDSGFRSPQLFYALLRFVVFSSLVENTPPLTFAALALAIAIWWAWAITPYTNSYSPASSMFTLSFWDALTVGHNKLFPSSCTFRQKFYNGFIETPREAHL